VRGWHVGEDQVSMLQDVFGMGYINPGAVHTAGRFACGEITALDWLSPL
jgi:hypothetical protein